MKLVSIIIVNYNGEKHLDDCLSSLLSQDYSKCEIIVVDNASSDRSEEIVRKYKDVKFIKLDRNLGLAEGCNVGARVSRGDYLCFVNNDMRFEHDFLSKLADVLGSSSDIFAVDALHFNWDGNKILHAGTVLRKTNFFRGHIPGFQTDPVAVIDRRIEIPWGCLANLMVRKDRFFELGGFDSTFFIDYEDADLCWRAWLRGWKTVYVPEAKAFHKVGMSSEITNISKIRAFHQHKNYMRFILKCMDIDIIMKMFFSLPIRLSGYLAKGRFGLLIVLLKAFLKITLEMSDILRVRREIKKNNELSSKFLLKKFLFSFSN